MSLIIATGSNLGDRLNNLERVTDTLQNNFKLIATSQIYESKAVDYLNQPDFLNQVLEFELPEQTPQETMQQLLDIETDMGRVRDADKGPRIIDLDILFWGNIKIDSQFLTIPHPAWTERSFVVLPLSELPFYDTISAQINIPAGYYKTALPYKKD